MNLPNTLAGLLAPDALAAVEAAAAPALLARAQVSFEVELEGPEGTFTLRYDNGAVTAKKGFAKAPLVSVRTDKGGLSLVRDQLQALVDGFPQAPALLRYVNAGKAVDAAVATAAFVAVKKLAEGTCLHFDVAGEGKFSVARGPVDEAERELTITVPGTAVRGLLTGAPLSSVTAALKGDRSVGTAVLAALAPVQRAVAARAQ